MKIKLLVEDQYCIFGVMNGDACEVEDCLLEENPAYDSYCHGLLDMITRAASGGLQQFSSKQSHYINENPKIYEFCRGPLRLIYFHGVGNAIVICTEIAIKKTKKADKQVVQRAIQARKDYFDAVGNNTLIIEVDENEDE